MKKILILLLIVLIGCTNEISSEPVLVGENGVICEKLVVAIDEANYKEFLRLSDKGDNMGILRLKAKDKTFIVEPNTVVNVASFHLLLNEVIIMNGEHTGKRGFVPFEFVRHECWD